MKQVAVIGAGSFGTALANVLADKECTVDLYARREELVREINEQHTNQRYLPDVQLNPNIRASSSLSDVLAGKEWVLIVTPSAAFRETVQAMRPHLSPTAYVAHATKGFDVETGQRMSEVMEEELAGRFRTLPCGGSVAAIADHAGRCVAQPGDGRGLSGPADERISAHLHQPGRGRD
jgi:glycerol-3-phosphate dehydrogenase (NAD(P)+)